jgi:hypothetical protein
MAEDRRLDGILDKISKSGIDSLSKDERSYLRKVSGEPEPKIDTNHTANSKGFKMTNITSDVESTTDCVAVLNEYKNSKWKRKTKFNIKITHEESSTVRVFTDGVETLSILQSPNDGAFLVNYDLDSLRPLIEKLQKTAKKCYTHDYGQVYLNPWNMSVWVVGGDGGIVQTNDKPSDVVKRLDNGDWGDGEFDIDFSADVPEIKNTILEAEYFPPMNEDEYEEYEDDECEAAKMEWIEVARAIDICNFE